MSAAKRRGSDGDFINTQRDERSGQTIWDGRVGREVIDNKRVPSKVWNAIKDRGRRS
jgi:hypothetical protein